MRGIVDHDPKKYDPKHNLAKDIPSEKAATGVASTPSTATSPK